MVEHILMRSYLIWPDTRVRRGQVDRQSGVAGEIGVGVLVSVARTGLPGVEILQGNQSDHLSHVRTSPRGQL